VRRILKGDAAYQVKDVRRSPTDGVLVAPFVIYAGAAIAIFAVLRRFLHLVAFDRAFSNPPVAELSLYRDGEARESGGWRQRFASLTNRVGDIVSGPQPSPGCIPRIGDEKGATVTLARPKPVTPSNPEELNPGLATSINKPPIRPSHPQ
jgi:hypothetical protein